MQTSLTDSVASGLLTPELMQQGGHIEQLFINMQQDIATNPTVFGRYRIRC